MQRLIGLDLARFLAFSGMVLVNFKYEVWSDDWGQKSLLALSHHIDGKATAIFVVLAGIGFVLMSQRMERNEAQWIMTKRALVIMAIGFINMAYIQWDILHFYAVFFLMGVLVLYWNGFILLLLSILFPALFVILFINFDYNAGWDWNRTSIRQTDIWTIPTFLRSWFFNGFHPVIAYVGYFFFGMALAKLNLRNMSMHNLLIVLGILLLAVSHIIALLTPQSLQEMEYFGHKLSTYLSLQSMPPMPIYIMSGIGAACLIIGICLRFGYLIEHSLVLRAMASGGRMALTLYLAHIWIGIGMLVHLNNEYNLDFWFILLFSFIFIFVSAVYAFHRMKSLGYGPFERLLRNLSQTKLAE